MSEEHRHRTSEQTFLDRFDALAGDVPSHDQRHSTEHPFFSLSNANRVRPILHKSGDTDVQVHAVAEHGMAIIWGADVPICAASQVLAMIDRKVSKSPFVRFAPYQLLTTIGLPTGNHECLLLKGSLTCMHSTVIRTAMRHGEHWPRPPFSCISEWEELVARSGLRHCVELVLPGWSDQRVNDVQLVLAIAAACFALSGDIEGWLYRVAREHIGRRPRSWWFELRHLYNRSVRLTLFSDSAFDVQRILHRQPLARDALVSGRQRGHDLVIARPARSTHPLDDLWTTRPGVWTSGAACSGVQSASVSGVRAPGLRPNYRCAIDGVASKDCESGSNSLLVEDCPAPEQDAARVADGNDAS